MPAVKNVTTIHLDDTVATRGYPFTQQTLDQIRDLRQHIEEAYAEESPGQSFMVPAPVVIARAVNTLWHQTFKA